MWVPVAVGALCVTVLGVPLFAGVVDVVLAAPVLGAAVVEVFAVVLVVAAVFAVVAVFA